MSMVLAIKRRTIRITLSHTTAKRWITILRLTYGGIERIKNNAEEYDNYLII